MDIGEKISAAFISAVGVGVLGLFAVNIPLRYQAADERNQRRSFERYAAVTCISEGSPRGWARTEDSQRLAYAANPEFTMLEDGEGERVTAFLAIPNWGVPGPREELGLPYFGPLANVTARRDSATLRSLAEIDFEQTCEAVYNTLASNPSEFMNEYRSSFERTMQIFRGLPQ